VVTIEFKPMPIAMAVSCKLIDENSHKREPGEGVCASPSSYSWADECTLSNEIYNSRAASDARYLLRRIQQDERRPDHEQEG
jgi:hypothetical protein